jgi:hypothetical protein
LEAGADGFLDKPLESLAVFGGLLMQSLPDHMGDITLGEARLVPDVLALRDDLAHAADLLDAGFGAGDAGRAYVAGFVKGVARHAHDPALAEAATRARPEEIRALLRDRLAGPDHAFAGAQV